MAPHYSTLAWNIPWMEEPGRLQSMGSLRVWQDWATSLSLSCIGEGNGNPLQCSCLKNPRDGGSWWAAIYGVAQSWTRLKRLSRSSSSKLLLRERENENWNWSKPENKNTKLHLEIMKQKIAGLSTVFGFQYIHQHQRKMRTNNEGNVRRRKIITK